jgi:hypothetical protein
MLSMFIDRSNGGRYFIVAKLLIGPVWELPRLSSCCKYCDENGLDSFGCKWWNEWCALLLLSVLWIAPAKRMEKVTSRHGGV